MTLKDEATGSSKHFRWNISCGIPLIGGKLEQVVTGDIQAKGNRRRPRAARSSSPYS